jgi:PKD repeat protein
MMNFQISRFPEKKSGREKMFFQQEIRKGGKRITNHNESRTLLFIIFIVIILSLTINFYSAAQENSRIGKSDITILTSDVYAAGLEPPEEVSDEVAMITFSDEEPIEGEICIINATIFNIGTRSADVTVYFYDGAPAEGDLIGVEELSINPLGHKVASTDWDTTGEEEEHTIHVLINPDDPANETDDSNNQAERDIVVNQIPVADAGIDQMADEDDMIMFDGSGSTDTPSDLSAGLIYTWDFGDPRGNESNPTTVSGNNLSAPSHIFTKSGEYRVSLTVSDDGGALDRDTLVVTIENILPKANATLELWAEVEDDLFTFNSSLSYDTPSDYANLMYFWDFDDGTNSGWINSTTVTHVYYDQNYYRVKLTVKDDDGETDTALLVTRVKNLRPFPVADVVFVDNGNTVIFNASETEDTPSDMDSLIYDWEFGDGESGEGMVVTHEYNDKGKFYVWLNVTDDNGETGEFYMYITIENISPEPVFGSFKNSYSEDELINFDASDSYDPDGEVLSYTWHFGDGIKAEGVTAKHSYAKAGVYKVLLAVRDDSDAENVGFTELIIENVAPGADAGFDIEIYEGDTAYFDGGNSNDTASDLELLKYEWDFGENETGKGKTAEHVYDKAGEYEVTLTVTDDDGEISVDRIRVIVIVKDFILSSIDLTLDIDPTSTVARSPVSVAGSISYEFADRIPENDVSLAVLRLEIVETGDVWYVVPDIYGKYEKTIEAPGQDGTYTVRATISRLGLAAEETRSLIVETPKAKTKTETNELSLASMAVAVGTLAAVGSTGAFLAGTDLGRYKFFMLTLPLYSKISKSAVLDNFTRGRIYEHIRMNPGQHYSGIKDTLELNNGCLTYHLKVLMRNDLIQAHTDGTHKRFYPIGMKVEKGRPSNIQDLIFQIIDEHPYISQREIADAIGIDISTVNYHVNIMVGAGIVQSEKSGKIKRYYLMRDQ